MDQLIALASNFGAPGLLIAYMIWDRKEQRVVDKDRIAADLEMAKSWSTLTERLNHVR
jgi:hypothetical protein